MNRRTFISTSAVAGVALAGTGLKCGGRSISGTIQIIVGGITELKPLFPAHAAALDKIVNLATSFNEAWTAGKFEDAKTFFLNLDTLVGQVIADLGLNASTRVKLLLASIGIAVRVIAALIQEDATPAAAAVVPKGTVDRVRQLADDGAATTLLKGSRP